VARSVATALSEIHRSGWIHGNLWPENILLFPDGATLLTSSGLAEQIDLRVGGLGKDRGAMAENGELRPFLYNAPEQTGMLKREVDGRANLYALGAILFECATGHPPFQATKLAELLHLHAVMEPPDAHQRNPDVRPVLALILNKLLAKNPDDRYQTCAELVADLDRAASGLGSS